MKKLHLNNDNRFIIPVSFLMDFEFCPVIVYVKLFDSSEKDLFESNDEESVNKINNGNVFHLDKNPLLTRHIIDGKNEITISHDKTYFDVIRNDFTKSEVKKYINDIKKIKDYDPNKIKRKKKCEFRIFTIVDGKKIENKSENDDSFKNIIVLSNELKIKGEVDEIRKTNNEIILIEKKSRNMYKVFRDVIIQCNAYLYCLREMGLDITKYKVVTPSKEFDGKYDEKVITYIKYELEQIRNMIDTREVPKHDKSKCDICFPNIKEKCFY